MEYVRQRTSLQQVELSVQNYFFSSNPLARICFICFSSSWYHINSWCPNHPPPPLPPLTYLILFLCLQFCIFLWQVIVLLGQWTWSFITLDALLCCILIIIAVCSFYVWGRCSAIVHIWNAEDSWLAFKLFSCGVDVWW